MTIKNIEDLKNIQVVCRNDKDIEKYFEILKELGFEVVLYNKYKVFYYSTSLEKFSNRMEADCYLDTYFFNKKLIKTLQKLINEEKEKVKEQKKIKDFEVAEDGRIIKINNYKSEKKVFIACEWDYREQTAWDTINYFKPEFLDFLLKYGLAYTTAEARDRAMFKLEIETKLKNIAERLNKGRKFNWEDENQNKYEIFYSFNNGGLYGWSNTKEKEIGQIYCLDENFLNVAKQEIGKENLIRYFTE